MLNLDSLKNYVERMELSCIRLKIVYNCGVCSINDQMTHTLRSIVETEIIKSFFSQLARLTGLDVKVYSNDWGKVT